MQIQTKIKLINYKDKTFKGKDGKDVNFLQAYIEDLDSNRYKVSIAQKDKLNISVSPSEDNLLINGIATLKLLPFEKDSNTFLKLYMIDFKEEKTK